MRAYAAVSGLLVSCSHQAVPYAYHTRAADDPSMSRRPSVRAAFNRRYLKLYSNIALIQMSAAAAAVPTYLQLYLLVGTCSVVAEVPSYM